MSQFYIAQVKRKHGIIERVNYNVGEGKTTVGAIGKGKSDRGCVEIFSDDLKNYIWK